MQSWVCNAGQEPPAATVLQGFVSRDGNIELTGLKLRLETAGEYSAPAIERFSSRNLAAVWPGFHLCTGGAAYRVTEPL